MNIKNMTTPTAGAIAAIGSVLGPIINFMYGPDRTEILSLFFFAILGDWYTGIAAARKDKTYSSAYGIKGIFRTIFILGFLVFANFADKALGMPGTFFYATVLGLVYHYWQSLTANAYRAGWEKWIPKKVVNFVDSEIQAKADWAMKQQEERGINNQTDENNPA